MSAVALVLSVVLIVDFLWQGIIQHVDNRLADWSGAMLVAAVVLLFAGLLRRA